MESRAVSTSVVRNQFLVAQSPSWSGKTRRLHLGLENCAVSALVRSVSTLIAEVATHPPRCQKTISRLRRLHLGLKVAPSLPWSGKSCRLHPGLESRTVSTVARNIFLVTPSPPRSEKSRRLRLGLKSPAVSILVWKFAPSPLRSEKERRLHLGRVGLKLKFLVAPARSVAPLLFESRRFLNSAVSA